MKKIAFLDPNEVRYLELMKEVNRLIAYDEILQERLAQIRDEDLKIINAAANHLKLDIARKSIKIRNVNDIAYRDGVYDGINALFNIIHEATRKAEEKKSERKSGINPITGEPKKTS